MKLLLVCAVILSMSGGAPTSDSIIADPGTILSNIDHPIYFMSPVVGYDKTNYKTIYIYKDGKVRKLLEHGNSIAGSSYPQINIVYFGARDGIYRYDDATGRVEKYGNINNHIIKIIKEKSSDNLYILTEDHAVYKVTEGGNKKVEIEEAKGAEDIMLNSNDDLFYLGEDKQPYVITSDGIKKIHGLPAAIPSIVRLVKTFDKTDGVEYLFPTGSYLLHLDGTSEVRIKSPEEIAKILQTWQELNALFNLVQRLENENN